MIIPYDDSCKSACITVAINSLSLSIYSMQLILKLASSADQSLGQQCMCLCQSDQRYKIFKGCTSRLPTPLVAVIFEVIEVFDVAHTN